MTGVDFLYTINGVYDEFMSPPKIDSKINEPKIIFFMERSFARKGHFIFNIYIYIYIGKTIFKILYKITQL